MVCCSSQCQRRHLCANHVGSPRETDCIEMVEDFYWFGSGSISSEGCEDHWWCGAHGDWGMFKPIDVQLLKKQRDALDRRIKELERGEYD